MKNISRKRLVSLAVISGISAATTLVAASPAVADDGDGRAACNSGEICLAYANPAGSWQKHYWNGGNDNGYWVNVSGGGYALTSTYVHDQASSLKNRDTTCEVVEVNYSGTTVVAYQYFPRSTSWVGFSSAMNDRNDAHWRCGFGGV